MKITSLSVLVLSICLSPVFFARIAARTCGASPPPTDHPRAGEPAPALTCKTPEGQPMSWQEFKGTAVLLYFHSPRTSNARKSIEQFRESLLAAQDLKERCEILLLVDDAETALAPREALASTGFTVRTGVSKGHELFLAYGVVAFPTLVVVNGEAQLVDSVRGYGTMFSFHALTATRYALGMIDKQAFDDLIHGQGTRAPSDDFAASPQYAMARRLIETGKNDAALSILANFADEKPPRPELMALVAHLQLLAGDAGSARAMIERLLALDPESLDANMLLARLDLVAGDTDAARGRLRGLDAFNPRVEFVRGLILEHEERFEEAADMYRVALGSALFLPE